MAIRLRSEDSVVVLIDLQPKFLSAIWESDRVLHGAVFLAGIAKVLGVPVLATVQNPDRMGAVDEAVHGLADAIIAKMSFSCQGEPGFAETLHVTGKRQVVLVGVETHICVSQTALDLDERGYEVVVCPDALSARTSDRHKLGMERMRDSGIMPAHTEAVAYEWLGSAENPKFREALAIVKARPLS